MAITFETARNVGAIAAAVFIVLGLGSAILLTSVSKKLALLAIFGLLALLAWTQRSALDTCVDIVRNSGSPAATCEFFGLEVGLGGSDALTTR